MSDVDSIALDHRLMALAKMEWDRCGREGEDM